MHPGLPWSLGKIPQDHAEFFSQSHSQQSAPLPSNDPIVLALFSVISECSSQGPGHPLSPHLHIPMAPQPILWRCSVQRWGGVNLRLGGCPERWGWDTWRGR